MPEKPVTSRPHIGSRSCHCSLRARSSHTPTMRAPSESEAPPCPRSISKAHRTQNSLAVPHPHGLDLISLLLHDYFHYRYRNEAPARFVSSFSSLLLNKIRRYNEYIEGNVTGQILVKVKVWSRFDQSRLIAAICL